MNKALVSIITVTHNSASTLERTINSIAEQTYEHIEYIIIDNCSNDGTSELIANSKNVSIYVCEKDDGIADAFNKGIRLANGDIIGIVNADDWLEPEAVSLAVSGLESADIFHGAMRYYQDNLPKQIYYPNQNILAKEMSINHPTVFIRKEIYQKYGLFNTKYNFAMDYDLILRFYLKKCIFFQSNILISNMSLGGTSANNWQKALLECKIIKINQGFGLLNCNFYYLKQVLRGHIRRSLEKLGLNSFINKYRQKISVMRKEE